MENKIKKYLAEIEIEKNVTILYACETGSRAWGFPSPDSDYDIRFIYKHHKDWYMGITEGKDTIERMLENNDIDISGWDIRKSLRLLLKSNPPLLEWIQSPIIYKTDRDFLNGISLLAKSSYSKIATIHHYLSMAKKSFEEFSDKPEMKLKKFFYALRTAIACKWILERDEIPPIDFRIMLEGLKLSQEIKLKIYDLIKLKSTVGESYFHPVQSDLNNFIFECIISADKEARNMPASDVKVSEFNSFLINTVTE
jgi:predicted nucleotidyltransferase